MLEIIIAGIAIAVIYAAMKRVFIIPFNSKMGLEIRYFIFDAMHCFGRKCRKCRKRIWGKWKCPPLPYSQTPIPLQRLQTFASLDTARKRTRQSLIKNPPLFPRRRKSTIKVGIQLAAFVDIISVRDLRLQLSNIKLLGGIAPAYMCPSNIFFPGILQGTAGIPDQILDLGTYMLVQ